MEGTKVCREGRRGKGKEDEYKSNTLKVGGAGISVGGAVGSLILYNV
jgi:preprotein translocase subunit Sss1